MLASLSIKNFALIEYLNVEFTDGLVSITGETGAGKSILLGGLSLILGKRADVSSVKDASKKCVIEATFQISNYSLRQFFEDQALDYESETIVRREILPSGKSRAFVNDSPVNLQVLSKLGERLIDIHSQHQTMEITNDAFQFQVIDALAKNHIDLKAYSKTLNDYKKNKATLEALELKKSEAIKEQDYNEFLLKELQDIVLVTDELEDLETEYETLTNVEDIKTELSLSEQLLNDEQLGAIATLTNLKVSLNKLRTFAPHYENLYKRIESVHIELDDVYAEINEIGEQLEDNPERLQVVDTRLKTINNLMTKHAVSTIDELRDIEKYLATKVAVVLNIDTEVKLLNEEKIKLDEALNHLAQKIHTQRQKAIPGLVRQLENILKDLGMPNAKFQIAVEQSDTFLSNGKDILLFLFSANKGGTFNTLKKAASGGELSRIMLAIKAVLAKYVKLPTIMFDEIDTGVSGEVSNKMGAIMKHMSDTMQVFTITHLPQIAAKGNTHYKVFKEENKGVTVTKVERLEAHDRILEIAQMLGGKQISNSALEHAKQLLN
ncbi:MAG: DNA repair protein RecN [Flavobacteriaceae bacterium]|nr:DNA repair protein RecN [Flavobacteriaceae bacterium]